MECDVCNASTTAESGVTIPADKFRLLLSKGWGIHESNVRMLTDVGIPREQALALLKAQHAASQSPWFLCPTCGAQAKQIISTCELPVNAEQKKAAVTVHMLSPTSNYTVEHWTVGNEVSSEHYEKFRDIESGELYAMVTFRGGEPELHLMRKALWTETKKKLRM